MLIGLRFTTGATSGLDPTLEYDYGGRVSIALTEGSPDLYVITIGQYKRILSIQAESTLGASVNITTSGSASSGTVTLSVTSNALANATVDVLMLIQMAEN